MSFTFDVPDDRFPKPALPTAEELQGFVERVIADALSSLQPIAQQAIAATIYERVAGPLHALAATWQGRAVERRISHSALVERMREIRDLTCGDATSTFSVSLVGELEMADDAAIAARIDQLHQARAHPDFEYETTRGPRKMWDHSEVPPWDPEICGPGVGWEFNRTLENSEAWERFDFHEERYWRRPKASRPENVE